MQFHTVILFYCVYLFAATALSIWCITHLYIDYLSAPLDQIHLSYTLHFLMMFYSSNSLFGVVEVTRFFMCCGWPLSWSNTRSVEDPLYDVISSTQIPIYNANNNDELMLHFLTLLIIYLTFYQNLFFSTSFCSLGFAWYRKTNCLGVTKESKNLKPLNGRS